MTKIARSPTNVIAGSCGQPALIFRFMEWVRAGAIGPFDFDGERDWEGCLVSPEGSITGYDRLGSHPVSGPYLVIGSRKDIAHGAFFVGASAEQAVHAAMAHHAECGEGVDVLRLDAFPVS